MLDKIYCKIISVLRLVTAAPSAAEKQIRQTLKATINVFARKLNEQLNGHFLKQVFH